MQTIRLLIADDHVLFRKGLCQALAQEPDLDVVGEAADGNEAITKAAALKPDVIVMDLSMPVLGGIEATRQIRRQQPDVAVLILTAYDDDDNLLAAMAAGASGYVLKDVAPSELAEAVRACARGDGYLNPVIAAKVLTRLGAANGSSQGSSPRVVKGADDKGLTPREFEVLEQIAVGASNRDIAQRLFISESTVKNHVTNIFRKLAVTDRTQAVLYALKQGWVKVQ